MSSGPPLSDVLAKNNMPDSEGLETDTHESIEVRPTPGERLKLRYRPDIAGLRGLGVIVIVLAHANIHILRNGFIFVDAFYVISGFLITGLLAKEYERTSKRKVAKGLVIRKGRDKNKQVNQQISLKNFYIRRAQRILPAALFVAWGTVFIAKFLFNATQVAAVTSDALWATFFGANVHFMSQSTDYFQFGAQTSPLQHYWSLSIEEQFYAVWPLLFSFAIGLPFLKFMNFYLSWRGRLTLVLGSVTFVSFVWMFISFHRSPLSTYFSTTARAWELGLGGLIAINVHFVEKLSFRTREWLSLFATLAFFSSLIFVTPANFGFTLWVPVFSIGLLLAVGHGEKQPYILRLISVKFLQVMGLLSYAIYLWHWPIFTFAKDLGYLENWWQTSLAILLSLILAVITYYLVERPFHQMLPNMLARNLSKDENSRSDKSKSSSQGRLEPSKNIRTWPKSVGSLMVALMTLSLVLIAPTIAGVSEKRANGASDFVAPGLLDQVWKSSIPQSSGSQIEENWQRKLQAALKMKVAPKSVAASLADLNVEKRALFSKCLNPSDTDKNSGCVVGSTKPNAKLAVVIGDSTALSISPALSGALDLKKWRVLILTRATCPVADVTPIIAGKPNYDCSRHRQVVFGRLKKLHPDLVFLSEGSSIETLRPAGTTQLNFWAAGYSRSLAILKRITPNVVASYQPPLTPTAVECVRSDLKVSSCFGRDTDDLEVLVMTKHIAAKHKVHVVVPAKWLCLNGVCPAIIDNAVVKFDRTHISIAMAKKLAPLLRLDLIHAGIIKADK